MKKLLLFVFLVFCAASVRAADSLTLKECYDLALKRSETIGIQKELIRETEGLILQSLGTALPKVAFAYSQKWQDEGKQQINGGYAPEAKFTLTQPLFTGFKEFAAIGASKHVGKQRQAELQRARELLFTDVSDAFYLYLSYQEDEATVQGIAKAAEDRLAELKKREAIGRSRTSEVASADAQLKRTEALLESVRAQREVAGQLLEFLIGRSVDQLKDGDLPEEKGSLDELAGKIDQRADVVAARESFESFKNNVTAARSAFFPSVSIGGNAYTKRSDTYEGNDWDTTLTVSVPIFNGTTDIGSYAQAKAQKNEADLRLSLVRRQALLDLKSAYTKWQAAGRTLLALQKALDASEKNYQLQQEDFNHSLVNNLDVLQALQDLESVRRDYVAAKSNAKRAYWNLKVATGDIEK
ncbi:MAG: TolC family protein [Candidatus Omnitrophica bacterium]|nr:TolC family protein [Candidatus Omnitrophota bacterium]